MRFAVVVFLTVFAACGGGSDVSCPTNALARDGVCVCAPGFVPSADQCLVVDPGQQSALARTGWHPDPDGDGLVGDADECPTVYDPIQANGCDLGTFPQADGPISDLRIEHATPYGAWLSFTSPYTTEYGWDVVAAWSTTPGELDTVAGVQAAIDRGHSVRAETTATHGWQLVKPIMLSQLEPSTDYYVAVIFDDWDGLVGPPSNVRALRTAAAPTISVSSTYPRVWATSAHIDTLKQRHASDDSAFAGWRDAMAEDVIGGAADPGDVYLARDYCSSGALLYAATGESKYRDAALILYDLIVSHWEDNELTANEYRWAEAGLGTCLDLLWNELSTGQRERGIRAMLADDEAELAKSTRIEDTDEYISQIRTWLINGLVACDAPGIDSGLSSRACAVLDAAKRRWFGIQEVMTRRDKGLWSQSGAAFSDGSFYGPGTSRYWMQIIWALHNAGVPAHGYAPFVRNNLLSFVIHPLTPRRRGYSTWGDMEDFVGNFDQEPSTFRVGAYAPLLAFHIGILSAAGLTEEAGWARHLLLEQNEPRRDPEGLPLLLFETSSVDSVNYRDTMSTAYWASGKGIVYDRTDWSENASFVQMQGGWTGVDHHHGDQGHFQWYRKGRWITHEAAGYDGVGASGWGHNTLLLQGRERDDAGDVPQLYYVERQHTGGQRIESAGTGAHHTLTTMESTGSYNSHEVQSYYYDRVQRALLWLKAPGDTSEIVVVYDSVDNNSSAPTGLSHRWNLQLDGTPSIDGRHASVELGEQRLDIDVVLPTTASLSSESASGEPGDFPGPLYNPRLVVNPGDADDGLRMVSVLRASDGGGALNPRAVSGDTMQGALVGTQLVLFSRGGAAAGDVQNASVSVPVKGPVRVWLVGLAARASYSVTMSGDTLSVVSGGSLTADSSGLLAVDIDSNGSASPVYTD